jgi:hypothetical protein
LVCKQGFSRTARPSVARCWANTARSTSDGDRLAFGALLGEVGCEDGQIDGEDLLGAVGDVLADAGFVKDDALAGRRADATPVAAEARVFVGALQPPLSSPILR